jgi:hypothetical protein
MAASGVSSSSSPAAATVASAPFLVSALYTDSAASMPDFIAVWEPCSSAKDTIIRFAARMEKIATSNVPHERRS